MERRYTFVWEPRGKNFVDDEYEDAMRRDYRNFADIPENKRSVRIWLYAFLIDYFGVIRINHKFLTQKQLTPEMLFVVYGWDAATFPKKIDNDAVQQYPWLFDMLTAMHAFGPMDMHHTQSIDVHDQGTKNYDADIVGRDEIERDNRWLSTRLLEDRTPALCREYMERNPSNISDVPREILTEDLCILALIKSRAKVWSQIPATFRTSKVWLVAFGMASDFKNVVPKHVKDEYPWVFELIDTMHRHSSKKLRWKREREAGELLKLERKRREEW